MLDLFDMFANDKIKEKIWDNTVGTAANILDKVDPKYGDKLRELKSTYEFEQDFSDAIIRAIENLQITNLSHEEWKKIKETLLNKDFINNNLVVEALQTMLLRPNSNLSNEVSLVIDQFSKINNQNIEQNKVSIVLGEFLVNLSKEIQNITLFREALDFYYTKSMAESIKKQETYSYASMIDKVLIANEKGKAHILLKALQSDGIDVTPMIELLEKSGENVGALLPLIEKGTKQVSYQKSSSKFIDWGRSRDINEFYGRKEEIENLTNHLITQRKKLILIDAMGGQGKTSLVLHVCKQDNIIQNYFDCIIWRTLENSPSFESIINDILSIASKHTFTEYESSINEKLIKLKNYINQNKCLVILDNYETIIMFNEKLNEYKSDYIEYSYLIDIFTNTNHGSTLLITSRVIPSDIKSNNKTAFLNETYIMQLKGLDYLASKKILNDVCNCSGSNQDIQEIIDFYSGNPLALDLVGRQIEEIYLGDISEFNSDNYKVFDEIFDLLSWHFSRINEYEKEVLYWLSIEREFLSIRSLRAKIFSSKSRKNLPSTLKSLSRKLPVLMSTCNNTLEYSLQPLIIEFILSELIAGLAQEIHDSDLFISQTLNQNNVKDVALEINKKQSYLLSTYTLADPLSDYYVYNSQVEQIIKPLLAELLEEVGNVQEIKNNLQSILNYARISCPDKISYTAGNVFNILATLDGAIENYNFSKLTVMNANLTSTPVKNTDFSNCKFINSTFNQTFGNILSVNFSNNSELFIASDTKGVVYQWNRGNYQQISDFQEHTNYIRIARYSPDNTFILSGSDDHTIKIWDTKTNSCINTFSKHHNWLRDLQFINDNTIISGDEDGQLYVWDLHTLKIVQKRNLKKRIWGFAINQNTKDIYISTDNGIFIYKSDYSIKHLDSIQGLIRSIDISKDSKIVAFTTEEGTIHLISTINNQKMYELVGHSSFIWNIKFNQDSSQLLSSSEDNTLKIWNLETKQCEKTLYGHTSRIRTCNFSHDNNYIISGSDDKTIRLWNTDGKCIHIVEGYSLELIRIEKLDSSTIISAGDDNSIRVWDIQSQKNFQSLSGHQGRVWGLSYDPINKILISVGDDSKIKIWNMETYSCINTINGHLDWIWAVSVNSQGVFVTGSEDNSIKLWNYNNNKPIESFNEHEGAILALEFHPNNNNIFVSASTDNSIKIWDLNNKSSLNTFVGHEDKVWSLKFNENGTILASASEDKTVRVWDMNTNTCICVLKGHTDFVLSVDFLSDTTVVSSSDDNTIKVWSLESGKCIKTIQAHTNSIWNVKKYNDDTFISCSKDGYIKVWNIKDFTNTINLKPDSLYEGMNILNITGVTKAQEKTLIELGATT